ncbi:MAG TPA: hypothetical protein VJR06_01770 [Nitrososphaerales archaeon]|nr:hypothetical protein [Nitrososphaerales archaeon]
MLSVRRIMLASGLFVLALGISLFAVGGSAIATNVIVKGDLRKVRTFLFFLIVGVVAIGLGSTVAAYSFSERRAPSPERSGAAGERSLALIRELARSVLSAF